MPIRNRRALALALVSILAAFGTPAVALQEASPPPPGKKVVPPDLLPGPQPPSVILAPSWARMPMTEYPAQAIAADVEAGQVTLICDLVQPSGALGACEVQEETPPGFGFADAAIAGALRGRVSPRSMEGAAPGARVRYSIHFRAPG